MEKEEELFPGASLEDCPVGSRGVIKGNRLHGWGRKDAILESGEQTLYKFLPPHRMTTSTYQALKDELPCLKVHEIESHVSIPSGSDGKICCPLWASDSKHGSNSGPPTTSKMRSAPLPSVISFTDSGRGRASRSIHSTMARSLRLPRSRLDRKSSQHPCPFPGRNFCRSRPNGPHGPGNQHGLSLLHSARSDHGSKGGEILQANRSGLLVIEFRGHFHQSLHGHGHEFGMAAIPAKAEIPSGSKNSPAFPAGIPGDHPTGKVAARELEAFWVLRFRPGHPRHR